MCYKYFVKQSTYIPYYRRCWKPSVEKPEFLLLGYIFVIKIIIHFIRRLIPIVVFSVNEHKNIWIGRVKHGQCLQLNIAIYIYSLFVLSINLLYTIVYVIELTNKWPVVSSARYRLGDFIHYACLSVLSLFKMNFFLGIKRYIYQCCPVAYRDNNRNDSSSRLTLLTLVAIFIM